MENVVWEKKGIVIKPDKKKSFSKTHAMIPTPYRLGKGIYRIFFSGRNIKNQSHISSVTIDINKKLKILSRDNKPILSPGKLGTFDDNGVTPSCVIKLNNNKLALYYIGWNPGSTVRMHLFGGLAISKDEGKNFKRWSEAPIIERNSYNPYLNTAPWVIKKKDKYLMYYVSGTEWINKNLPRYNIKLAYSNNGLDWSHKNEVCIDFKNRSENALARPFVFKDDDKWKMFFSAKGKKYKLGYAESFDAINWERKDKIINFNRGNSTYDNEMMEYFCIIKENEKYFMLYNGNNYGKDGIALAVGKKKISK